MNVALFGGTFNPVHLGHLAVARAAVERYGLARVCFVPAYVPPHKSRQPITAYEHRYAMLALATAGEKTFVPSLLEAPDQLEHGASYSVDTVRRFKRTLSDRDRLFFIIGIDAFLEIATWRSPEAIFAEAEFIVVSRPGFSLEDVERALPASLRPSETVTQGLRQQPARGDIVLPGATIHLLDDVQEKLSATQVRHAAASGGALDKLVGTAVAEYIRKERLYPPAVVGR